MAEEVRNAVDAYLGGLGADEIMLLDAATLEARRHLDAMIADLDRLTGIAIVREKLADVATKSERLGDAVLDHERRLIRLETTLFPSRGGTTATRRRLPRI